MLCFVQKIILDQMGQNAIGDLKKTKQFAIACLGSFVFEGFKGFY